MLKNDLTSPSVEGQLQNLNEQLSGLEAAVRNVIGPDGNLITALQQAVTQIRTIQRGMDATRIRKGLEDASRIFPKSKTVIFVARECCGDERMEYFGDNIKYAFISFCEYAKSANVACYFLTSSERLHRQLTAAGLPCLPWFVPDWDEGHMRILLSAKVAVLCNIFCPVDERHYLTHASLQGARFIQLWHGIPLKAIGMESVHSVAAYRPRIAEVLAASGKFDLFVGAAASMQEEWARRFAFQNYAAIGYPRTDVFFREPSPHDLMNVDMETYRLAETSMRTGKSVILYAPTFRDGAMGKWFETSGIEAVANHCKARGYVFCVNLHPFEGKWVEEYRRSYPHIHFVEPLTDIYPVMKHVGVLMTDYSSLAFDFLLLDRPIVFYRPDHADYIARSRSLIADHEEYVCGDVAADPQSANTSLDAAAKALRQPGNDSRCAGRQALRQRLYDHADGNAGQRLAEIILAELDK